MHLPYFLHSKAVEILWASQSFEISNPVWQILEVWIIKLWDNSHRNIFHLFNIFYMLYYFHVMFPTALLWWNVEDSLSNSLLTIASTGTVYICWGWIWDRLSFTKAQHRNTRCHFWILWPKSLKTYNLPAGNNSTVVCLLNKPWKSTGTIHKVFTSTCTRNTSAAFLDSRCGLGRRPHMKILVFPKKQRQDDWYKVFCLFQKYAIDCQKERCKFISQNTYTSVHLAACALWGASSWRQSTLV